MNYTRSGICQKCKQKLLLRGKSVICRPCGYPIGECVHCKNNRKLRINSICTVCYIDRRVRVQIDNIEKRFSYATEYNKYIFNLYLIYIRRYRLRYYHVKQSELFVKILSKESFSAIQSWMQIYEHSKQHPLPHKPSSSEGSAWTKVGLMLQELGVLAPRREEFGRQLQTILNSFDQGTQDKLINPFLKKLAHTRRTDATLLKYTVTLSNLNKWINLQSQNIHLLHVNSVQMENYFNFLVNNSKTQNPKYVRNALCILNRFYCWCIYKKKILINPCDGIKTSTVRPRLLICSPEETKKIYSFIKNTLSNPEQALMLALVLFFGLTLEDLSFAKIETQENKSISIILRRKPRSCGRRYYNRQQVLYLPVEPKWFLNLQKRFYSDWAKHYTQVKCTYPHYQLILALNNNSNLPISSDSMRTRMAKATLAATGARIPYRVLRQTCGHTHTQNQDASLLTNIGWSPKLAFQHTWLPRTYFVQK